MDVLNAITKDLISYGSEKVSDNIEPGGTGDPPCHRSRMEQRETGYVG